MIEDEKHLIIVWDEAKEFHTDEIPWEDFYEDTCERNFEHEIESFPTPIKCKLTVFGKTAVLEYEKQGGKAHAGKTIIHFETKARHNIDAIDWYDKDTKKTERPEHFGVAML